MIGVITTQHVCLYCANRIKPTFAQSRCKFAGYIFICVDSDEQAG